jgi:hypothetical protein
MGTTKRAICVPEPAAMPIDKSIFPFLARIIALLCSAAFPTIPIIMAPTNSSPNPNSFVVDQCYSYWNRYKKEVNSRGFG